tara:strand:+ start:82 stop:435 length:354 start_codon:yes stop_codon:yes gene_type:complete
MAQPIRDQVAAGDRPAVHPVQHCYLQLWAEWRKVERSLAPDGTVPGIVEFAAATGTSVRRASRILRGNYEDHRYPYGSIETWVACLQEHWASRGIARSIWLVRRPDGRYAVAVKPTL